MFLFARLAWAIGASDDEEALCLRDREKQAVCKMDRRLAGGDGYGWLWGRGECLGRRRQAPIRKSSLPQGLPVQVKPTYTEPGLPQFTFPTSGGSLLGGSADTGSGSGDGSTNTNSGGGSTAAAATLTTR